MLGFTAAEAAEPGRTIPKAINQVILRVLIFYIGSMLVPLCLAPWTQLLASLQAGGDTYGSSPFVRIFSALGNRFTADALNFIILTAALSVYNGMVYGNSRLLYGMAQRGHAPKWLAKVSRRGVPSFAILLPALFTGSCVVLNYVMPNGVVELLISLAVACLVLTWFVIVLTHLKFRRKMRALGIATCFSAPGSPVSNWLCLGFLVLVVVVMLLTPAIRASALAMPIWVGIVLAAYRCARWRRPQMSKQFAN